MFTAAVASTSSAVPKSVQRQEAEQVTSHDEQACCSVVSDKVQSRDRQGKEVEEEKKRVLESVHYNGRKREFTSSNV